VLGILFIPVTFSFVEYASHRYAKGGKGTSMDSKPNFDPVAAGKSAGLHPGNPEGGHS
jgi:HAE1 family hydrophobic/amphiphilic exporter-1